MSATTTDKLPLQAREIYVLPHWLAGTEIQTEWEANTAMERGRRIFKLIGHPPAPREDALYYLFTGEDETEDGLFYGHVYNAEGEYVQEIEMMVFDIKNKDILPL